MSEGYDYSQIMFRNQHGGVQWDKVKVSSSRSKNERLRSSPDKRLFDALDGAQEGAFYKIAQAHQIMTNGLGAKIQGYGHVSGGQGDIEYGAELLRHYKLWHTLCKQRYVSPIMALDVIVFGLSLKDTDEKHKFQHGTAKKNLIQCLDFWGEI